MKRIIILALATATLYSCDNNSAPATNSTDTVVQQTMTTNGMVVPDAVTTVFTSGYPDVGTVQWQQEDSMYRATFNNNGLDMAVQYYPNGTRYAVVAAMATEYLPDAVKNAAKTLGPVMNANKITMDNGTTRYEVIIRDEDYFFDESGAMIQEDNAIEEMKKAL